MQPLAVKSSRYDAWRMSVFAIWFLVGVVVLVSPASAVGLGDGICEAVKFMTGPVGKAIATAGIIVIAVGALLGRVSWGMAVMIAAGIAGIFGAPAIAKAIAEKSGTVGAGGTFC